MTFVTKPCAEKIMTTSGDISDFPSSSGTSGYSGGESYSQTEETASVTSLVICCTVVLNGLWTRTVNFESMNFVLYDEFH